MEKKISLDNKCYRYHYVEPQQNSGPYGFKIKRNYLGLLVLWCFGFMVGAKPRDGTLLLAANIRFQVPESVDHNTIRPKHHRT